MLTHHESFHAQTAFENAPSFVIIKPTFSQHRLEPLYVHERRPKRVLEASGYATHRQLRITQLQRLIRVTLYGVNEIFQNRRLIPRRHSLNVDESR